MAQRTKIEWTETTWNPVTGCTKISDGCRNCYAERMSLRLKAMGVKKYRNGFDLTIHKGNVLEPLLWPKPQMVFVCSMSDLFHDDVSENFILKIFSTMNNASQHIFQVLTKRSERLLKLNKKIKWTKNIWTGVTVESELYINRIEHLNKTSARLKFLSLEPLLSEMPGVPLSGIDWVIAGGESGIGSRSINPDWVRSIQTQCQNHSVPFFFKQWGGFNKKKNGRTLDGKIWDQMPDYSKRFDYFKEK